MAPTQHIRTYSRSPSPTKNRSYDNSAMSLADAREGHSTAYTGYDAGADINSTISSTVPSLDARGYDDIRLGPAPSTSTPPSPAPASPAQTSLREGLGSRLLANAQPAAAALSRSGSVLHSRAKSWVSYAQKLNATGAVSANERATAERTSGAASSTESDQFTTALPTPQEQHRLSAEKPRSQHQPAHRIFGDLFTGESAPVHLGLAPPPSASASVAREAHEPTEHIMEYRSEFTARPALNRLQRMNTAPSAASASPAELKPARTSWFTRSSATAKPLTPTRPSFPAAASAPPLRSPQPPDELLTMNFSSALFPHGAADPLDPRAFHDLLRSSTALLQKFQTAYGEKSSAVHAATLELDAQREEVEECETRARHLKAQLADVARRAEDAARANAELQAELVASRREAEKVRQVAEKAVAALAEAGLEVEEDPSALITPRRPTSSILYQHSTLQNFKRASAGSQSQASDSGFESETDSASVLSGGGIESGMSSFSTAAIPRSAANVVSPTSASSSIYALRPAKNNGLAGMFASSQQQPQRPGLSRQNSPPGGSAAKRLGSEGAAWATVEKLRAENGVARDRVELMQRELTGCIEFVEGLVCGTGVSHG